MSLDNSNSVQFSKLHLFVMFKTLKRQHLKKSERKDQLFNNDQEEIVEIIFGSEGLPKSVMIPYSWRPTIKNLNQFSKLKYPQFDILNRG